MSDSAEDRKAYQESTAEFFKRFAERSGTNLEELKKPEVRVKLIKELQPEQFLDLMAVANSQLRGEFRRWKRDYQGQDHKAVVTSQNLDSPDLIPPDDSEKEFTAFYEQMKADINESNLELWAAKLYTAIIFLHMFSDGNGRLARNAFSFLHEGTMTPVETAVERPGLVLEFCKAVNRASVQNILIENGCTRYLQNIKNHGGLEMSNTYVSDEREGMTYDRDFGLSARLKFVAAKRAHIFETRAKNGDINKVINAYGSGSIIGYEKQPDSDEEVIYEVMTTPWTPEEVAAFEKELTLVKSEWFKEAIEAVNENPVLSPIWLEVALEVPNPLFLNIFALLKLMIASEKNDPEAALAIFNMDKNGKKFGTEQRAEYITQLGDFVKTHPHFIEKAKAIFPEKTDA